MFNELGMSQQSLNEDSDNLNVKSIIVSKGQNNNMNKTPSSSNVYKSEKSLKEAAAAEEANRKLSFSNSNPNFQFQIRRNLVVSILEARDLVSTEKKKKHGTICCCSLK